MRSHLWFVLLKINVSVSVCVYVHGHSCSGFWSNIHWYSFKWAKHRRKSFAESETHLVGAGESHFCNFIVTLSVVMALVYLTIMAFSLSLLIFWIHLDRKRLSIKRNSESGTINEYVKRFIAYGICRRYCYTQLPTYTNVHVLMFTQYVSMYIARVCVYGLMSHH